jgi:hypothetical protein
MTRQLTSTGSARGNPARKRKAGRVSRLAVVALMSAPFAPAPPSTADSTDSLTEAVMAVRGVSCGPLRSDPIVAQAAAEINDSTDKWINNVARAAPVTESTPLLKDLGYGGSKSTYMLGAAHTAADSIKALLLQGYRKIPDCSYVDYGVSSIHNESKDLILTAVVLAA